MRFLLTVSSVDNVLFRGEVDSVTCPGEEGELTVLAGHEALMTPLLSGTIRAREDNRLHEWHIDRGVLEVSNKEATILV